VRARIEHIFAEQKDRMGFIRTIGIARARIKIGLANLVYNINASSGWIRLREGEMGKSRSLDDDI
jgi:transposase, IS5 family